MNSSDPFVAVTPDPQSAAGHVEEVAETIDDGVGNDETSDSSADETPQEAASLHCEAVGSLLTRLDDQTLLLSEAAHEFAALLHNDFNGTSADESRQKWHQAVERLGPIWHELQTLAQDVPEGGRLAVQRDVDWNRELRLWIPLLQDHPAARRLDPRNSPTGLVVWITEIGHKAEKAGETQTLGDWITQWIEAEQDPPNVRGLTADLRALRNKIETLCTWPLEDELSAIISAYGVPKRGDWGSDEDLATRRDEVFRQRLGWNGEPTRTLGAIAADWKVSRERIRQIAKLFKEWRGQQNLFNPVLEHALRLIQGNLPGNQQDLVHLLQDAGVTRGLWSLEALAETARSLRQEPGFMVTTCGEGEGEEQSLDVVWDGENSNEDKPLPQRIWRMITTHVWERGIGFSPDIEAEIAASEGEQGLHLTRLILGAHPSVRYLHREQGWFWLDVTRVLRRQENRLLTAVIRALSVARRLSVRRLLAAVTRVHLRAARSGYDWEMPSEEIFAEWCYQQSRFRIEAGEVEMRDTPPWTEVLDNTEAILVGVLQKHGPLLTRWKFQKLAAEQGVPKPSFYIVVDGLSTVEEVDEGILSLVGASITEEQLDAFRADHSNFAKRFWLRYGRLDDGRQWMSYRLSQGVINNGTLNIPLRMRGEFAGRYEMLNAQGAAVGTLSFNEIQCWGLKFFFRTHASLGDRVTLLIDEAQRQVVGLIGSQQLPVSILREVESLDSSPGVPFEDE